MSSTKSALFVCLGNICRSPIAEGVFSHLIEERGLASEWKVDSAATAGYHTGKSPDPRALSTMKKHGIKYNNRARTVKKSDFKEFDYIFGMDEANIEDLKRMAPKDATAKIQLLGSYHPDGETIIRDPYYDDDDRGFEKCYEQCAASCAQFLGQI